MKDFIMVSDMALFDAAKTKNSDLVGHFFGMQIVVSPLLRHTDIILQICSGNEAITLWKDGTVTRVPRLDR